jgi:hypothetical protein
VDDDEDEDVGDEDESVGVLVCGGKKEGGDLFEDLKGVLITTFITPGGKSSLLSNKRFEYIENVCSRLVEVDGIE